MAGMSFREIRVGRAIPLSLLVLGLTGAIDIGAADPRFDGTRRMAERLQQIDREMDIRANLFENRLRAFMFGTLAARETDPLSRLGLLRQQATETLNDGQSLNAARQFEAIARMERELGGRIPPRDLLTTQVLRAVAWLRLGEQENCLTNHTIESCLLPIQAGGVHQLQRGSREAVKIFEEVLRADSYQLDARWLLNIAYMTLGEYPDKVPPQWLVPAERFKSDYDIKRFPEVAGPLGLNSNDVSGGTVLEDFNNDGHLDVLASAFRLQDQLRLFVSNGDGTFAERTREAGLEGLTDGLNMVQADYNNDGFTDVLVLRGAWLGPAGRIPNSLLRNNGDGTFSDVTLEAGVGAERPTQTAVFFDFNGDGWLDLFVGNESHLSEKHRCELFRNLGNGRFAECAFESGIKILGYVKGVTAGDYNNDGRPDLFLSVLGAPNRLLRNDGPVEPGNPKSQWKFTDVSSQAGVTEPLRSFPCWFFDYDNDGREDIFVAGYDLTGVEEFLADLLGLRTGGAPMKLYRNHGDGTFEDASKRLRLDHSLLAMGANFGDLDNDGWLDFYLGTGNPDLRSLVPNKMYRNAGGEFFQDVTTSGGFGHLQKEHAIGFGDLDNDGDQDVYANIGGAFSGDVYRNALFENPGHGNRWLKLKLEGVTSNRSAIGAKIKVVAKTPAGERSIYKTVNSGGSFGANPLRQELGLGDARSIERLEIFWPTTGKTQVLTGLAMDGAYRVKEDAAAAEVLELEPTPFKKGVVQAHGHH
jgi:hypothetical protein